MRVGFNPRQNYFSSLKLQQKCIWHATNNHNLVVFLWAHEVHFLNCNFVFMKIVGEYEKALFVISDEPSLWKLDFFLTETKLINGQNTRIFFIFFCQILRFFHTFLNFCSIAHPNMITSDKNLAKNKEDSWFNLCSCTTHSY